MTQIPVVVHGDPESAIVARLKEIWEAITEDFTPTHIGIQIPETLVGETAIQVQHEAVVDLGRFPARERSQTRVTCWAPKGKRDWVKALATRSLGELVATPAQAPDVGQQLGSVRPRGGRSGVIADPDSTNLAVWFLVTTSLRGNQLTTL